ncbi:kinase-like protein [Mollisia scopiformis]|uniref:non-specific serine/threonine protein kinase n=1 Tax=Mollisia scopiformis TaxID=149040 RepID=A0A194WY61_MOLSC|nr:kinase-like protein [Mollisia scopiformis]KUJ12865.1 kinase-like protein [Mollisia scopiformis]
MARVLDQTFAFGSELGPGWKGKKILGKGDFGIVSLWEYVGDEAKTPAITQIVVKQTYGKPPPDPFFENRVMKQLSIGKSKHIVRQYRDAYEAQFARGKSFVGIYLEYCPGGDLTVFLDPLQSLIPSSKLKKDLLLEVDLWAMFFCLASAVAFIARGTEDFNAAPVLQGLFSTELVHLDIKPDNIFLGNRDEDHVRYPILKVGDFGSARSEAKNQTKSEFSKIIPDIGGAAGWRAPEYGKEAKNMRNPRRGACSNIFQIGCIMHALLMLEKKYPALTKSSPWQGPFRGNNLQRGQAKYTHGQDLFRQQWAALYSNTLRELIMECLMFEPDDRPLPGDLQRRVAAGLDASKAAAETLKLFENNQNPPVKSFEHIAIVG